MSYTRRDFLKTASFSMVSLAASSCSISKMSQTGKRPNVILIMTDDQGYGDLACHGNPVISTPNLDKLRAESVRFTNFHVDPTCSPTRGALMTGKYSHRAGVWHTIAAGNHLRASEMTMANAFKASGYSTAMIGKWHLGSNYPYRPMDRGFDEWLGQGDGGTGTTDDYFTNDRVNDHYLHNGNWEFRKGYAPDVFFDHAASFIKNRSTTKPFFMYLTTYVPHSPHTLPDTNWTKKFEGKIDKKTAYFFAGIERIDRNIGQLRNTLRSEGLADNTIVIFMTDNGGTGGVKLFNAGMRGHKGQVYDGGHRVPLFIHWPTGRINHGADVDDLTAHIDILPSLIDICGLTPSEKIDFDGRSFKPQLFQPEQDLPERTLCVELQRTYEPKKWENAAAMSNRWRLVNNTELYDIKNDPSQKQNIITEHPEVAAKLRAGFDAYWKRVTPNDRQRVVHIIGHPNDPETFLHSSDWYLPWVPWNHAKTSKGAKLAGSWLVKPAKKGTYQFDIRRWPKEINAPISGVPSVNKQIDAWDAEGGKKYLIYNKSQQARFRSLPVAFVHLKVGNQEEIRKVNTSDTHITIDIRLEKQNYEVRAELLDEQRKLIAGAYYVYVKRISW
jgi:arylsulfatase A-like enzyme